MSDRQLRQVLLGDRAAVTVVDQLPNTAIQAVSYWQSKGWPEVTIGVTLFAMRAFRDASDATRQVVASQMATAEKLLGRRPRTFSD